MTIEAITDVAQFDTVVAATNIESKFHTVGPGFKFPAGGYVVRDQLRMYNEAFKFYVNLTNKDNVSFKMMLGCDNTGTGKAIQMDFTATTVHFRLVTTSGFDVAYDTVIQEKEMSNKLVLQSDTWIECKVIVRANKLEFYFGNRRCIQLDTFTPDGNNWGWCTLTGSDTVYTSDMFYVYDQIIYGNVNLNGAPDAKGVVVMFNQNTYELVARTECDANGEYMIFLDDDPAHGNKYFMYGYVEGLNNIQPRGVSNISL